MALGIPTYHNNASPTETPMSGYVGIHKLAFSPINPNALGVANRTPINTLGDVAQRVAAKFSRGKPVAKIVIGTQQARF